MDPMDAARIAGFLILGLTLGTAALLGAPLLLLLLIGAVPVATLFLPDGVGAAAATNLARRIYDRQGWEAGWDRRYLPEREDRGRRGTGSPEPDRAEVEPDLFPEDLGESKAWLRTLAEIRRLPAEPMSGPAAPPGDMPGPRDRTS